MEEETMKEAFEIQPNLQPEQSINVNEGGKWRKFWKYSTFKEESEEMIIELCYSGHFIVQITVS
jgi:hypothetical protein